MLLQRRSSDLVVVIARRVRALLQRYHVQTCNSIRNVTCENKISITPKIKRVIVHCHNMYLLYPGLDRTKVLIFQHLYCQVIQKEPKNNDFCQCKNCQQNKTMNLWLS